jgi:hypothetical protein
VQVRTTLVVADHDHTCVLLESGNVHCWGSEFAGKTEDYEGGDAIGVATGSHHSCALPVSGEDTCWGEDGAGGSQDRGSVVATATDPVPQLP